MLGDPSKGGSVIGVIGGTGLYRMAALEVTETIAADTPYGAPSSEILLGVLSGRKVAFLARHGRDHERLPSEINYRANIWSLKSVGVRTIVGVSAVGSLREEIHPGDLALPSQYLDFTKGLRAGSFFGQGIAAHVSTAHPTCAHTAELIARSARSLNATVHEGKTYACVEGPRFGTRAESYFLRSAGADLVGMTNVPEAFLAAEAQLGYATIAVATDYDCWLEDPSKHVTTAEIVSLFQANLGTVQRIIAAVAAEYRDDESRPCRHTLAHAILTPRDRMTDAQRAHVDFLSS